MKSNEQQSPVDEFFRQHEAEIPVSYDPENWNQLTALLDSAQPDGTPKIPPTPATSSRLRFRNGKGWWVSGVWVLTITIASWVIWQTAGSSIPENSNGIPVVPSDAPAASPIGGTAIEAKTEAGSKSKTSTSSGVQVLGNQVLVNEKGSAGPNSVSGRDSVNTFFYARDSLLSQPNLALPADSIPAEKPQVKKKKHLFW